MTRPVQHSRPHPHTYACTNTVEGRGFAREEEGDWSRGLTILVTLTVLVGMVGAVVFARDIVGAAIRFAQTIGVI